MHFSDRCTGLKIAIPGRRYGQSSENTDHFHRVEKTSNTVWWSVLEHFIALFSTT